MNIRFQLNQISKKLANISATPHLDAEILFAHALKTSRVYLYTNSDKELTEDQIHQINILAARRLQGEPIAYIIGKREFWSLDLTIDNNVLIPRPDTELLVELTLTKININTACIADLGTGSGAIALALAKERPNWKIIATDASERALKIAQKNAQKNAISNVEFYCGNWCAALPNIKFDAIVSNPPYIAANDEHLKQGDVRFEPKSALVSESNGLKDLAVIIKQAPAKLKPNGIILLEHGFDQAKAVQKLLKENGCLDITTHQDLAGFNRVTAGLFKKLI